MITNTNTHDKIWIFSRFYLMLHFTLLTTCFSYVKDNQEQQKIIICI